LYRDTAPVPFSNFIYRDYFPAVYQTFTAIAPAPNKTCTMTAKSTPFLSCHRDNFSAKETGYCPVLASGNTTSLYCRAVMVNILYSCHLANIHDN
jgi:hypothetical protein